MFAFLGHKWGTSTDLGTTGGVVEWSVSPGTFSSLPQASGYSNGDFDQALTEAFDTWESVASIDFQRVSSGGDINIIDDSTTSNVVGYAFTPSSGGLATSSTIAFSNNLPGLGGDWAPYGDGGINFFAVALHEIGHSIGLDHVEGTLQIMNSTLSGALTTLRDGDIDGAQELYGTDLGDVDAVPEPDGVERDDTGGDGADSGGGGGGGILLGLLGLLTLLLGGLFTGGAAVVAAARYQEDDGETENEPTEPTTDTQLTDLLPMIPIHEHDDGHDDGIHVVRWDEGEDADEMPFLM